MRMAQEWRASGSEDGFPFSSSFLASSTRASWTSGQEAWQYCSTSSRITEISSSEVGGLTCSEFSSEFLISSRRETCQRFVAFLKTKVTASISLSGENALEIRNGDSRWGPANNHNPLQLPIKALRKSVFCKTLPSIEGTSFLVLMRTFHHSTLCLISSQNSVSF